MAFVKKTFISFLLLLCFAQAKIISAYIFDSNTGEAISGASVYFTKYQGGTVSGFDGYFYISDDIPQEDTIFISMIGYDLKKIPLSTIVYDKKFVIELKPKVLTGEHVVVTATRIASYASETSVSMDVIGPEIIENTTAYNIAELLNGTKALQIKDYGGIGGMKTMSLRGATAGQTLVMLDGQRINNPQNGEVDLSLIPLDHLERVEIVRGGASALYGSDALGGVINLITDKSENGGYSVSLDNTIASFGTYSIASNLKSRNFSLGYSFLRSEGDFTYYDKWGNSYVRDNNDVTQHHFNTRLDLSPIKTPEWGIGLRYDLLTNEKGAPGAISPYYHYARMEDNRQDLSLMLSYAPIGGKHSFSSQSYAMRTSNHYINEDPRDIPAPINETYITNTLGEELQMISMLSENFKINYGLNLRLDDFLHQRLELNYQRFSYDAYIVNESEFDLSTKRIKSIKLTPSLRYNGNTDFSDQLTPKLGLLVKFGRKKQLDVLSNIGMSYRSPTFNDLYWPEDSWAKGNPDLLPESGWDWDAGIRYRHESIIFESVAFDHHMKNLILWQDHGGLWWPENISRARIFGLENSFNWTIIPDYLDMTGQYTFLDARDKSELYYDNYLTYRPIHSFMLALNGHWGDLDLNINNHFESKRYTIASNAEVSALPAYLITDIGFKYSFNMNFLNIKLMADIKNLFNVSYKTLKDFPMPGREYRITLGITYNHKKKDRK